MAKKVAIVYDWLTTMGGAEKMLLELHKLYPEAPIYTSVYYHKKMTEFANCDVRTTYLQWLIPKPLRYHHVLWPVLRAFAFRKLDLSEYDLIISSASAEAKAVKKRPDATHICYCHTPTRYYWSHYEEFKNEFNFGPLTPIIRPFIPLFVRWMRKLDLDSVKGVDYFIANSNETKARIKKYYNRDSEVIFPPIDTKMFKTVSRSAKREGFIVWGRHVPYKRFDLAIEACNQLNEKLTVVGSGPDTERLKKLAGPTITFAGRVSDEELVRLAHSHKAFLFPGEEDFGMSAVEALAAGLPVIAYGQGGSVDIVDDGKNGVLFEEKTIENLVQALKDFQLVKFSHLEIQKSTEKFSINQFKKSVVRFFSTI